MQHLKSLCNVYFHELQNLCLVPEISLSEELQVRHVRFMKAEWRKVDLTSLRNEPIFPLFNYATFGPAKQWHENFARYNVPNVGENGMKCDYGNYGVKNVIICHESFHRIAM